MSKLISLTKNYHTVVDDKYFEILNQHTWCAHLYKNGSCYAEKRIIINDKATILKMHRHILQLEGYVLSNNEIDHINGDGLDNRVENLRICSRKNNSRNRKLSKNNTSGYKGVIWINRLNKWRARIKVDYKTIHLGYFVSKDDAARAYNLAASKYFGDFARLNTII